MSLLRPGCRTKCRLSGELQMTKTAVSLTILGVLLGIAAIAYFNLTIFIIQPIGAVPEGRSLIIKRTGQLRFIESADAICERRNHRVSLLCRGGVLSNIAENNEIYLRLPYSHSLYLVSTGGAEYDR